MLTPEIKRKIKSRLREIERQKTKQNKERQEFESALIAGICPFCGKDLLLIFIKSQGYRKEKIGLFKSELKKIFLVGSLWVWCEDEHQLIFNNVNYSVTHGEDWYSNTFENWGRCKVEKLRYLSWNSADKTIILDEKEFEEFDRNHPKIIK